MATATGQPPPQSQGQKSSPAVRKSRTFSFRSHKSSSSSYKVDLHETPAEKQAKRLQSKADPTVAMQEAEPSAVAQAKSSLVSLRSIQHKDAYGNPIVEPDLSNPTRSRWERPLETIRSFEAAIDSSYNSRRSILPRDTEGATWGVNRRTSYYNNGGTGNRYSSDPYYASRPPSVLCGSRPNGSQSDLRSGGWGQRDSYYYDQHPGCGSYGAYSGAPMHNTRRAWSRMSSDPHYNYGNPYRQPNHDNYPIQSNNRSYDTATTGSGSGSSAEPAGYQTDPTSDNSSIDRMQTAAKGQPEPVNDYGIGFGQSPSYPTYQPQPFTVGSSSNGVNDGVYNGYGLNQSGNSNGSNDHQFNDPSSRGAGAASPAPLQDKQHQPVLKKAIPNYIEQAAAAAQPEKRKSWFARRFSRHG